MQLVPVGATRASRFAPFELMPTDQLLKFADAFPDVVPQMLAQHGTIYETRGEELIPTTLLTSLMERFGDSESVRASVGTKSAVLPFDRPAFALLSLKLNLIERIPDFGRR